MRVPPKILFFTPLEAAATTARGLPLLLPLLLPTPLVLPPPLPPPRRAMASLMLSAVVVAVTASEPSPARFVIAGYAPDYRLESLDLSALAHNLTDVLLFSIAPTPQGTIDPGGITQIHHMRAARAKKAAPHLRALVSMGGGGRSAAFPQAVGSRQRREALAKALVKYCKRGKLDGADIDYEAALGPTELRNLIAFLKLLRQAFDAATPPLILLTLTR